MKKIISIITAMTIFAGSVFADEGIPVMPGPKILCGVGPGT